MEDLPGCVKRCEMIEVGKHGERQQEKNVLPVAVIKIKQQRHEGDSNVNNWAGRYFFSSDFCESRSKVGVAYLNTSSQAAVRSFASNRCAYYVALMAARPRFPPASHVFA